MKKAIILSNGEVREMSFEEVLAQFNNMLHKSANDTISKIVFNKPEKDDIMQELRFQTWEAFNRYDGKHAFSTYLTYRIQHGVHRSTNKMYAKKRTNENGTTSLNKIISGEGPDRELEGLLGEEDRDINSVEFREFITDLEKKLNSCEKIMLKTLMDKNDFSVRDLGDELGVSRQAANNKIRKFREKMANLLTATGYVEI
jgi:RNA polymerase sigma factor (sigma-70 family)